MINIKHNFAEHNIFIHTAPKHAISILTAKTSTLTHSLCNAILRYASYTVALL